jgi:tRNA (mo5U34)-methyltransferase
MSSPRDGSLRSWKEVMNRAEIEQAIGQFSWHHTIHLGEGIYTPGQRSDEYLRRKLDIMQIPEDLSGISVLDIGCNEGFFCIEAKRRGASRILAVDKNKHAAMRFSLVKKVLNHDIEFRLVGVDEIDKKSVGTFDMVLLLSVFHHLRYPFLALDKIASVTNKVVVMEVYVIGTDSSVDYPVMTRAFGKTGKIRLLPDRRFLTEMLQDAGFRKVEVLGRTSRRKFEGIPTERIVLKAYK